MTTKLERVVRLHSQGYTNDEIAEAMGWRSDRTVIRYKRAAGLPNQNGEPATPEQMAEIRRLSEEEGWPPEEIAETLGVSYNAAIDYSIRGPGKEWSAIAARCAIKYRSLWDELRSKR